jgi:adenylosuccinate synthase
MLDSGRESSIQYPESSIKNPESPSLSSVSRPPSSIVTWFPSNVNTLSKAQAIYETVPGWDEDITKVTDFHKLPASAQNFVCRIEQEVGTPITMIGVGPERNQTIFR